MTKWHAVARSVGPHDAPLPLVQAQVRAADHRHLWLPRLGQLVGPDAQDVGALQRNRVDGAVLGAEPVLPLVLDVDLVLEAVMSEASRKEEVFTALENRVRSWQQ